MADTGSPFFIPYVEPTDLVRDYPAADEAQADAVAAALNGLETDIDNIPVLAGIGSNVVSVTKRNAFITTSKSLLDIPGMAVTITPSTASSKIMIISHLNYTNGNTSDTRLQLSRNGTLLGVSTGGGSFNGVHTTRTNELRTGNNAVPSTSFVFLDSPATTSARTYKIRIQTSGGTLTVNRSRNGHHGATSSITAIEVAA